MAHITVDKKRIHIGYFNTLVEATLAHMLAKIKYHPSSPISQEYLRKLTMVGQANK